MKTLPLAYYAIHTNLEGSYHFDRLKKALGTDEFLARALITGLWRYAASYAPDGQITAPLEWVIEKIGWHSEWCPFERAAQALRESGFIEGEKGNKLHSWEERQPCIDKRIRDRERVREKRSIPSESFRIGANRNESEVIAVKEVKELKEVKEEKGGACSYNQERTQEQESPASALALFSFFKIPQTDLEVAWAKHNLLPEMGVKLTHDIEAKIQAGKLSPPKARSPEALLANYRSLLKKEFEFQNDKIQRKLESGDVNPLTGKRMMDF